MAKVTLVQVYYNHRRYIKPVFDAMLAQSYKDTEIVVVISGNDDDGKEIIEQHYPSVKIIDPGYNIGFAQGHNRVFATFSSEFFQLVNPDLILSSNYVEEMLKVFDDARVGAATGKLLRYDFENNKALTIIDTTGVVVSKTGRARDRGQHEVDTGQYDTQTSLLAVSGAGSMYRKRALEAVKYIRPDGSAEYFDQDFHSYWEDVDLSWRMVNAGFTVKFVPHAAGYHGRGAGSSEQGYKDVRRFIQHHKRISPWIRQLNYKNHIFLFIKNSPKWYLQFFIREFFYQCYVLIFETSTLKILPTFFKQLPLIWKKRKWIKHHRTTSVQEIEKLLT